MKRSDEARRHREMKKFGKQVQAEKIQDKAKRKKAELASIERFKSTFPLRVSSFESDLVY